MTQDENNSNDMEVSPERFTEEDDPSSLFLVSNSGVKYSMHLFKTINEIAFPIRAHNAFAKANIMYLGDLVTKKYSGLISIPDLGRKSLETVKLSIANLGLAFEMDISPWPPVDLGDLRKQYEIKIGRGAKDEAGW